MKRMIFFVMSLLVAFAFIGCSATPLSQNQVVLTQQALTTQAACYERLREREIQIGKLIAKADPSQVGLMVALHEVQENNKQMMAMVTGHNYDPCKVTTGFDVQIAEIKEKNSSLRSGMKDGASLGRWVVGGLTVSSALDKIGSDTITYGNNNEINKGSKNTSVSGNENDIDIEEDSDATSTENDESHNDNSDNSTTEDTTEPDSETESGETTSE